jgi:hypothetical protein
LTKEGRALSVPPRDFGLVATIAPQPDTGAIVNESLRLAPALTAVERRAMTARASVCRCGRPLDRHSRRVVPNAGVREYVCGRTRSLRFESATLPALEFDPEKGLVIHDVREDGPLLVA